MSIQINKPQYFIGTVTDIEDNPKLKNSREFHEIIVDIPGVIQGVKAFPEMSELDEPKVGDQVLLLSLDPLYNSYFIYRKLKENDFIGFRDSGKMVDITPDYITVGVFKEDLTDYGNDEHWNGNKDGKGKIKSNHIAEITIDNKGNITVEAAKDNGDDGNLNVYLKGSSNIEIHGSDGNTVKIDKDNSIEIGGDSSVKISGKNEVKITGDCTIKCDSNVKIEATSNCDIKANASCTIKASASCKVDSPNVTITGGVLNVKGTAVPGVGPFCGLPNCIFTGAPHGSSMVTGT